MARHCACALLALVLAAACGDDSVTPNAGSDDSGGTPSFDSGQLPSVDAGPTDTGTPDTGEPDVAEVPDVAPDTGKPDVSAPVDTGPADTGPLQGICLLNNCKSDQECAGCTAGRTTCKLDEGRCIACDPTTQTGCKEGETCTSFGICAPVVQTCATDGGGNPLVSCEKNSDCAACSPQHQVCDPADGQCKACTATNTSHCLQTQICVEGRCADKCPKACLVDGDCQWCGTAEKPAKGCFQHQCAQCSETWPCPQGQVCEAGNCIKPCGIYGSPGACQTAAECGWCGGNEGDPEAKDAWDCKFPINGATYGVCTAKAAGCSDLGAGVAVLPEPWSQGTNLCSGDGDCAGVGIQYNVGKLVKDLIGSDTLDLGFAELTVQDANVEYGMNACASVNILGDIDCGVCVPCRVDQDCKPIGVDKLAFDLFKGEALAQIAAAFLLDLLYGKEADQNLNFRCQSVAAGYGVCIPCGNPLKACGKSDEPPPGSGKCEHEVCAAGSPLDPSCGDCAKAVCSADAYCCTTEWDNVCVKAVDQLCTTTCGGGGGSKCDHGPCEQGGPMSPQCSPCVEIVCKEDPYCCNQASGEWDNLCVDRAASKAECASQCQGACAHDECSAGAALVSSCSPCATKVCADDPFCCSTEWDSWCVDGAKGVAECGCP